MAKIYGLNGALRGKQGNNVFSIQNGTQVVKAYQPVVSNPRTFLQQIQRSKFSLAGKISSVVPSGALVGLSGGNKRARRALFVRNLATSAVTTSTPSGGGVVVTAQVPYINISFANGSLPSYAAVSGFTAVYAGLAYEYRVHVTLSGFDTNPIQADAPAGYGELVIVCMFDPSGSRLDACQYAQRTNANMEFDFPVLTRTGCHVCVYLVSFAPLDGTASFRAQGAIANGADGVQLDMLSDTYLAGMRFGRSILRFSQDIAAVSSMVAPVPEVDTRKKK